MCVCSVDAAAANHRQAIGVLWSFLTTATDAFNLIAGQSCSFSSLECNQSIIIVLLPDAVAVAVSILLLL